MIVVQGTLATKSKELSEMLEMEQNTNHILLCTVFPSTKTRINKSGYEEN